MLLGLLYGLMATLYIWLSGVVAASMAHTLGDLARIERIKGFAFVAATAIGLFLASWVMFRRLRQATREGERLRRATVMAQSRVLAGELAAAVAHDFNNTLMVAQCAIEDVASTDSDDGKKVQLRAAQEALAQGRELALRLAHTARGQSHLRSERRDLVPVTQSMLRALAKLPRLRGRAVQSELCDQAVAEVDVLLYEQMLANLVLNAADACPPDGVVRVLLTRHPEHVRLEVHDNGPGVPPDKRESIFTAFESSKPEGLGLGLLSVRAAVVVQGGTLTVDTSPLGGAAFIVQLASNGGHEGPTAQGSWSAKPC
jgi:signal transduction histidine kinase